MPSRKPNRYGRVTKVPLTVTRVGVVILMGPNRLNLEKGDHFAYLSTHTKVLTWGQVIEEPSEPGFLMCQTYSTECPDGTEGLVQAAAIMFKVDSWAFEFARVKGWPSTVDELYTLSRQTKGELTAH